METHKYTLEELQTDADRTWVPDPILIAEGLSEIAAKVLRRVGPPIAGYGPEVFLNPALHDVAIGAEAGFSAQYLVIAAFRLDTGRPTIYVDRQSGYRALILVRNMTGLHHGLRHTATATIYVYDPALGSPQGLPVVLDPSEQSRREGQVPGRRLSVISRIR